MPPYVSYFSDAESAKAQWNLRSFDAQKVCDIWRHVRDELNTTYANAEKNEQENYFTQKAPLQDDPSTQKTYFFFDAEISKAEFKELVDIQRALVVFRALYTGGQKDKARVNYAN